MVRFPNPDHLYSLPFSRDAVKAAAVACVVAIWQEILQEQRRSARRRARLRRAILLLKLQEGKNLPGPRKYARVNRALPVLQQFFNGEQDFLSDYRMRRTSIQALIRLLPGQKATQGWGKLIMVLVTVYWLAHGLSYRAVSHAFHIPKSTLCRLVHRGTEMIAALRHEVIRLPAAQELDRIGQSFEQLANSSAFSKCVGAIDACHVHIKTPLVPGSQVYVNRKLFLSIQLQAVCDGEGRLLNTFVGCPGSVHHTRVLKNSRMYKETLYPPPGYFIVGDGGYPCIDRPVAILTPYVEPLQGRQSHFNHHHAKAHSIIGRVFGMMKMRWKCLLLKALDVPHKFVPTLVTACAVLHNICLTAGDTLEPILDEDSVPIPPPRPVRGEQSGHGRRDSLAVQLPRADHDYL